MSDELIERVAKAIIESSVKCFDSKAEGFDYFKVQSRAALEASGHDELVASLTELVGLSSVDPGDKCWCEQCKPVRCEACVVRHAETLLSVQSGQQE